ncbi:hypothetical protein TNCV_4009011 [Trichonephila clavipes]|nr:hypothetical protein TNCV_4009011 [Trichonephila clavipes]
MFHANTLIRRNIDEYKIIQRSQQTVLSSKRNENRLTKNISFMRMNKMRKTPIGLDCPTVSSEEFVVVDDVNVCTTPIMADKDIL